MRFINLVLGHVVGRCWPLLALVRFPEPGEAFVLLGSGLTLLGGGLGGMKEGRANDGGSLVVERARAQRLACLLHHPSSLSPPAPSQGSATADRVVFSPSLSASLAPARVPPPSLVILCTNRYRLGRAHHTPYRYRPPPPWLGVLECCVGGGVSGASGDTPMIHLSI